ncbi:adenylate/guanylate cyclase domain-containing protein [bacterium]|nr:adenylate/guanylate cyclase domain-containing protein [bacterium]
MSESIRQLSAIMFSDIVDYTALMQADEKSALNVIRHYNQVLQQAMTKYNGKVVNDYGDGNLCLFSSATDSVNAAIFIQGQLQAKPKVPLRIGLHIGETIFESGKAMGDGVNVASRIQSFGQANTILISKNIYDNIKNRTDFKSVSLGHFEFKNVEMPMEIFALVSDGLSVPVKKQMHGKGRPVIGNWKWVFTIILIVLLSVISYLVFHRSEKPLLAEYQDDRIAVLPFENHTNDHRLDVFGSMTADWIIQSLLDLDNIKVVTFQSVEDHLQYASIRGASGNQVSFADRTGAAKIIKGSFYLQSDKIIVKSQLLDARTGEVEIMLPEIAGPKEDLQSLVQEISSRFAGYFESRGAVNVKLGMTVPRYEAYIKFREANQFWGKDVAMTIKFLGEAIALDSAFYLPYGMSHALYFNRRQWRQADSVSRLIDRKFSHPTGMMKDLITAQKARRTGNLDEMYNSYNKVYQKDPKDISWNLWAAIGARSIWKYEEALSIYRSIDPATVNYDVAWKAGWARDYAYCCIRLNYYEEAREVIRHIPQQYVFQINEPTIVIYAKTGQDDSLRMTLSRFLDNAVLPWGRLTNLYIYAAENYALLHDSVNQVKWARLALERQKSIQKVLSGAGSDLIINPNPKFSKAFYLAGKYEKAAREAEAEMTVVETYWESMSRLGCAYARLGKYEKVRSIISKINSNKDPYVHGEDKYALAKIYAALGEKEQAIQMLAQAFARGFGMAFNRYAEDSDFIPLHGYGPYEEFVKPR